MSKEFKFFIFLLESYVFHKKIPTPDVLSQWDRLNITKLIISMYERYHIESIENAFDDIDMLIR